MKSVWSSCDIRTQFVRLSILIIIIILICVRQRTKKDDHHDDVNNNSNQKCLIHNTWCIYSWKNDIIRIILPTHKVNIFQILRCWTNSIPILCSTKKYVAVVVVAIRHVCTCVCASCRIFLLFFSSFFYKFLMRVVYYRNGTIVLTYLYIILIAVIDCCQFTLTHVPHTTWALFLFHRFYKDFFSSQIDCIHTFDDDTRFYSDSNSVYLSLSHTRIVNIYSFTHLHINIYLYL